MAQKIGFYTLDRLARQMCKYVVQFTPLIKASFPNSTALHAALEAANAACSVLSDEIRQVAAPGV